MVAFALTLRMIPPIPSEHQHPFDVIGFCLCGLASSCLLYGMELIGQPGENWSLAVSLMIGSLFAGSLMIVHLLRTPHPLFDLRVFWYPTFQVTMLGRFVPHGGGIDQFSVSTTVSSGVWLQRSEVRVFDARYFRGKSGDETCNDIHAQALWDPARLDRERTDLCSDTLGLHGNPGPDPSAGHHGDSVCRGLSRSMQFTCLNTLAFSDIPPTLTGQANVIFSLGRQLHIGVGIAAAALSLRLSSLWTGSSIDLATAVPSLIDFQITLGLIGGMVVISTFDSWRLAHDAAAEVTGHRI